MNSRRVFLRNDAKPVTDGKYVLYWMQINRRMHYNYALDFAIEWANRLNKPLLIYEGLILDYPWASDRFHRFFMEGMAEHLDYASKFNISYFPLVEDQTGVEQNIRELLFRDACLVVSDEYPVFIMRQRNSLLPARLDIPYYTVDANGIIPMGLSRKAPYSAFIFRKTMQRHFIECYTRPPAADPLGNLLNKMKIDLPDECRVQMKAADQMIHHIDQTLRTLPINHGIGPLSIQGTRLAGLDRLHSFLENALIRYGDEANHPDANATSKLSPWLHFGLISVWEVVHSVFEYQPPEWDLGNLTYRNGTRLGFFGGHDSIQHFLDEIITWRETGFHFAQYCPEYDRYETLPDWVRKTLEKHSSDPRDYLYRLDDFEKAETHDNIWNAAQRQLKEEGIIHNYLRMLWGKKILEWSANPRDALAIMIELNNRYAADGRDPNSYSGIFWVLGRFDRPWQERNVLGKVRYMSSDNTVKKVRMKQYLKKFGD